MNSQGPGNQSSRLYVGGLTLSVNQKDIDELFNKFGKILEIRMNRTFAFVQFSTDSEAQAAIKELNGTQHFGRRLDVQVARHPKAGGGPPGGAPGGGPKDDGPNRDSRDRSPIGRGGGGGGGRGGRGGFGGGGGRGGMYNSSGGRGGGDEPGFGGRGPGSGDFRSGPDYRGGGAGGGDFPPPRNEGGFGGNRPSEGGFGGGGRPSEGGFGGGGRGSDGGFGGGGRGSDGGFGGGRGPEGGFGGSRGSDSGLFPGGGRDFSLAPPTGFREGGSKFWGGGGGGGSGLNEKAFENRGGRGGGDMGPPPHSFNQERPPTHPVEPLSVPNNERTNDIEIIIVDKSLTEYGEMIERRMCGLGFSVDVLFPHEAVPLPRVLANIASRGTLYAVVITHVHQINGSLTLHILHGRPQEHRNMAIEDAITLLLHNYETYTRSCREKGVPNSPPEQIRHLLTQVLNGRPLTGTQYEIVVQFLLQEKLKLEPHSNPDHQNATTTAQQAELQTRILSILNKTASGGVEPPSHQPPPALQPHGPLLQDPSIQKALDNLIQGGDILRKIAPQQSNPFARF